MLFICKPSSGARGGAAKGSAGLDGSVTKWAKNGAVCPTPAEMCVRTLCRSTQALSVVEEHVKMFLELIRTLTPRKCAFSSAGYEQLLFEIPWPVFPRQKKKKRRGRIRLFLIRAVALPVVGPQPALFTWPTPNLAPNGKLPQHRAILA